MKIDRKSVKDSMAAVVKRAEEQQPHLTTFLKWWYSLNPRPSDDVIFAAMEMTGFLANLPERLRRLSDEGL